MSITRKCKIVVLVVFTPVILVLMFWMGGRFYELRNIPKDYFSQSRFAQLRCALLTYHERNGAFPPTKYQAKAGGPMHSWRVLLLPFIDADPKLYSKYNYSQEWNSPNNIQAVSKMPDFNFYNMNRDEYDDIANYLAIGDGDDWPYTTDDTGSRHYKPLRSLLIVKGADKFLIVEDPNSKIQWMEPKN